MRPWRDYKPSELALAALVALPIPFLAAYALALQSGPHDPDLPSIDRGAAVPIRVKPVLDLESPNIKLGGGKVKVKMPSAWADPTPPAPQAEVRPSTRAKDDPAAIPSKELPLASSASPDAPPDARSAAPSVSSDAATGQVPATTTGGAEVGSGDGKAPPGPGDPGGDPNGDPNADPRKKNAARRYLGRVVAWFTSRFRAPCANLPPEERGRLRAVASVTLGPDGTVVGYTLTKSGNPDIDSAAERAMQSAQGQQIPPPPEDFPELRPNSTNVTFVCGS